MIRFYCDICKEEVNYSGYYERDEHGGEFAHEGKSGIPRYKVYVSVRPENSGSIICPTCSYKILKDFVYQLDT